MRYDVKVTVRFYGVEADSEEAAQELVDEAMGSGAVLFTHPTTKQEVASEYDIEELPF